MKPLNEYITIQQNDEGRFYAVHLGGQLFLAGHDGDGTPIWSENLQDSAIYCAESAQYMLQEYPGSIADPISVDLSIVV